MRLTTKVTLALLAVIIFVALLNFLVFYNVLFKGYKDLQRQLALDDVDRCLAALKREADYLAVSAKDWAQWDDTYAFITDLNADYEKANLEDAMFRDIKIALMQYYDVKGAMVWSRALDPGFDDIPPSESFPCGPLPAASALLRPQAPSNSVAGIVTTKLGPMVVAANTILTTGGGGPARGVLVMGRWLNEEMIAEIAQSIGVDIRLWQVENGNAWEKAPSSFAGEPLRDNCFAVHDLPTACKVYATIDGVDGLPALLLEATIPCTLLQRGRISMFYVTGLIAVLGPIFLLVTVRLMYVLVVGPLKQLTHDVLEARRQPDQMISVALKRDDELGTLSKAFEESLCDLARAKDDAEKANRAKSDFLAAISHELRTPLNGIVGLAELITTSPSLDEHRAHSRYIIREAETLVTLINELLDSSKIEAGKLTIEDIPFSLQRLMDDIVAVNDVMSSQKGLTFNVSVDPQIPPLLRGDPHRIRQILINLVGNALKFTERGGVSVAVGMPGSTEGSVNLRFEVRDSGMGISKERQSKLFQRYVQADDSTARRYGGTGLGMSIVRDLVTMMGGQLGVESKAGKGTMVWFSLNLKKGTASDAIPVKPHVSDRIHPLLHNRGGRILLVEDYVTSQQVAAAHLQSAGYEVVVAQTGNEALKLAAGEKFDLILMDIRLPDINGFDVTNQIRAGQSPNADTPVIAITADVSERVFRQCMEAGMSDLLAKPFRRDTLLAMIDEHLAPGSQAVPIEWDRAVHEFAGNEKLLVEVVLTFLNTLREQLTRMWDALEKNDLSVLGAEAHSIKGGAGNLAAEPMVAVTRALEGAIEDGDTRRIKIQLKRLSEERDRLEDFVHKLHPTEKSEESAG